VLTTVGVLAPALAHAAPIPKTCTVDGKSLVLNGTGMRQATVFKVDVYKGALWLPQKERSAKKILSADAPWRIELHFVRDVEKEKLAGAWTEGFAKNAASYIPEDGPGLTRLNKMMGDMKSGQVLRLTYAPGKGTEVVVAGKKKGVIAGKLFARGLLSVWLGPAPPNAGLKKGLLGG
jgi:hypothetical protein